MLHWFCQRTTVHTRRSCSSPLATPSAASSKNDSPTHIWMTTTSSDVVQSLRAARSHEKQQALFYRALAVAAEATDEATLAERLNELHADEQHHFSRLSARLL